ncbi:nucleophosmin isoform X2 [Microcaecilia unicolor]|uniref:Nucleophosmin n=1 Tax=Microcaecilia unicolor TaxID=1415580 RepID=A0A6P7YU71_9AMPH|nr:nucleophosmin isoform X2 [Microcaecilia unicolor]
MEDSVDVESMAQLRPQNFLFGCELKADKKEFEFAMEDDETEHQLSLRTVSLGIGAKDELHVVEAEGLSYEGKHIKVTLASLKASVQPTVSLGGFEITPPVVLRLKSGSGPVYISGQHLVALEEDIESSEEEEKEDMKTSKPAAKRAAAGLAAKSPLKKVKLEEDDDDDDDDDDDEDEDDETPVKMDSKAKTPQKASQNGKASKATTPVPKQTTPGQKKQEKPQTPKTPKQPLSTEEIKAKIQSTVEKGGSLPKLEPKFVNYVKNCFRTTDQKVIQELWKWRQTLKDGK